MAIESTRVAMARDVEITEKMSVKLTLQTIEEADIDTMVYTDRKAIAMRLNDVKISDNMETEV